MWHLRSVALLGTPVAAQAFLSFCCRPASHYTVSVTLSQVSWVVPRSGSLTNTPRKTDTLSRRELQPASNGSERIRLLTTMVGSGGAKGKGKSSGLFSSLDGESTEKAVADVPTPDWFAKDRVRCLTDNANPRKTGGCVLYWMCRDQRADDNWAILFARHLAEEAGVPLKVGFVLGAWAVTDPKPTLRYADFMLKGLKETEEALRSKRIPFHLMRSSEPKDAVPALAKELDAVAVVTDMSPLRNAMRWAHHVGEELNEDDANIPLFQVDAHNVVPVWTTSDHMETMARTIRPKIHARPDLFTTIPELSANANGTKLSEAPDWKEEEKPLDLDRSVKKVTFIKPGSRAAKENLQDFIDTRLRGFADLSNDPNQDVCSNMSAYFNHGQMSAQAAALHVKKSKRHPDGIKAFVEQAIVRRELSDNLCFYNHSYDNLSGAAKWARESLDAHAGDEREWKYSLQELEEAKTHEDIWNAAQLQLVRDGKMHNFLRMYWAKKILEWSPSPKDALERCIFLNDKYEIDGRDPNGFAGCAWSVMGIHDMGWKEREIFGKIRYMNYNGCKRKFDIQEFVSKYSGAAAAAEAAGGTPMAAKRKGGSKKGGGGKKSKS